MTIEDLTPAEREEVQLHYLRAWLCRKARAKFDAIRKSPATVIPLGVPHVPPAIRYSTARTDHARAMAAKRRKTT